LKGEFILKSSRDFQNSVFGVRAQTIIGVLLVVLGVLILYLLRDLLFKIIVVVLGVIGILLGIVFILGGLALILWRRRTWFRTGPTTRT